MTTENNAERKKLLVQSLQFLLKTNETPNDWILDEWANDEFGAICDWIGSQPNLPEWALTVSILDCAEILAFERGV